MKGCEVWQGEEHEHEIWVFVFQIYQICHDGFDCYWFWVMMLSVMGLGVAGGRN
jgi:hypothetical protein